MSNETSKERVERCYNESVPAGNCILPYGHLGLCKSEDEAEIERLRAALDAAHASQRTAAEIFERDIQRVTRERNELRADRASTCRFPGYCKCCGTEGATVETTGEQK